jgi:hypothetical protein
MKHQRSCSKCLPSFTTRDVSKKAEFDSECLCFHEVPERRFERNEAEVKHKDLRGDFQQSQPTR